MKTAERIPYENLPHPFRLIALCNFLHCNNYNPSLLAVIKEKKLLQSLWFLGKAIIWHARNQRLKQSAFNMTTNLPHVTPASRRPALSRGRPATHTTVGMMSVAFNAFLRSVHVCFGGVGGWGVAGCGKVPRVRFLPARPRGNQCPTYVACLSPSAESLTGPLGPFNGLYFCCVARAPVRSCVVKLPVARPVADASLGERPGHVGQ